MQIRGFENAIEKVEQKIVENCFTYRSLHEVIILWISFDNIYFRVI